MPLPAGVAVGISVADQILGYIGMDPKDLGKLAFGALGSGDKKRRLAAIEATGMQAVQNAALILKSIEGKTDETAAAVRDQLIASLSATIALLVRTADLDGSSTGQL